MSNQEEKYIVLYIEGGLGKNIAATALIRPIKKKYPDRKLIIVASWAELFLNDPDLYRVYAAGHTPYFYENYIKDKDTIVFRKEPYNENSHIMRQKTLMKTWLDMYDLEYNDDNISPMIFMNYIQKAGINKWKRNKPIMLIHTNGGPFDPNATVNDFSWTRDMPPMFADEISKLSSRDYHVIQVCKEKSFQLPNVEVINGKLNMFDLFCLLLSSEKRLLIDSCLQHAAAAFKLPSTVLWNGTSPEMFGYHLHDNIESEKNNGKSLLLESFLFDYDFNGIPYQCPYNEQKDTFDLGKIIKSLNLNMN